MSVEITILDRAVEVYQHNIREAEKTLKYRIRDFEDFKEKYIEENRIVPSGAKLFLNWRVGYSEIIYLTGISKIELNEHTNHYRIGHQYTKANRDGSKNKRGIRIWWLYEDSITFGHVSFKLLD